MTQLVWDAVSERRFETGVDRGVLYLPDESGVVWNGLTSVDEKMNDSSDPCYMDGIKYLDSEKIGNFSAILKAFTYPDEFEECVGISEVDGGLFVGDQPPKQFGLTYRTRIGNDVDDVEYGYQIHIVYNALAISDISTFISLTDNTVPMEFSWTLVATPVVYPEFRPTAHFIVDSTQIDPDVLQILEDTLYGTDISIPHLPPLPELIFPVITSEFIVIIDHGDGTWSAIGPAEKITMLDSNTFQITEANATYLDVDTYNISSDDI